MKGDKKMFEGLKNKKEELPTKPAVAEPAYVKCSDNVFVKLPNFVVRNVNNTLFKKLAKFFWLPGRVKEGEVAVHQGLSGKFRIAKNVGFHVYRHLDEVTIYSLLNKQAYLHAKNIETDNGTEFDIRMSIDLKIDYDPSGTSSNSKFISEKYTTEDGKTKTRKKPNEKLAGLINFKYKNDAPVVQFANELYGKVRGCFSKMHEDDIKKVTNLKNVMSIEMWQQMTDEAKKLGLIVGNISIQSIDFAPEIEDAHKRKRQAELDRQTREIEAASRLDVAQKEAEATKVKNSAILSIYFEVLNQSIANGLPPAQATQAAQDFIKAKYDVDIAGLLAQGQATTIFTGIPGSSGGNQPLPVYHINPQPQGGIVPTNNFNNGNEGQSGTYNSELASTQRNRRSDKHANTNQGDTQTRIAALTGDDGTIDLTGDDVTDDDIDIALGIRSRRTGR